MRIAVPALATLLALAACHGAPETPHAGVTGAVVNLPPIPDRPGAAYFTVEANRPTRLTGISSPDIGRIELHESMMQGTMMTMQPLANVPVTPGRPTAFAPGGKHAMLYDIAPSVHAGGTVRLTFAFEGLPPVSVDAEVRAFGADHADH
jgi:copper(I)-binding protein